MTAPGPPPELVARLAATDDSHLLRFWEELDDAGRERLATQAADLDFAAAQRLYQAKASGPDTSGDVAAMAATAAPPAAVVRLPQSEQDRTERAAAIKRGEALLHSGAVGAILVAGGQGTRLGFDKPKGMFPVGPVSGTTLFALLAGQLKARGEAAGVTIPLYVMTSPATDAPTREEFAAQNYYGLGEENVVFFCQGTMPAVDDATGKALLAAKDEVAVSPDGHGGLVAALKNRGALDDMQRRGVTTLYYHQVDNPTAIVCDPAFLGAHRQLGGEVSTKVVAKVAPEEKMGVVCDCDGVTQIIEYSDLPDEAAAKTDADGGLLLWAGNTAIHCFERSFLERLASDGESGAGLPFHVAHKKVPHLNDAGELVEPTEPNAYKFERFIFDSLPLASVAPVVETDREREFNPVKNAEGSDSPATAKAALTRLHHGWLEAAGATIADGATVEILPSFALDEAGVKAKVPAGTRYDADTVLK
ncbi:UTP--glucose-1-phosphate uridylyltransferase [Alienimonas chondri]|uniref:Uridylyltransferase n=1 Tax=Alienimonas chondri TaxID=2681879 RepID=A0ABX1VGB3_9PLAN|nr:UDPGP type 1 family protein [Alienimonas chondri]NNJ27163.1 putative uridylyltransferase [Alienimonas chondri]